jgi:lysyl-tRNA synthetase class 1
MSSSKGNVISIGAALEVAPPEALRYLVLREKPARTLTFDPGLPLLKLQDEMEERVAAPERDRAIELSLFAGFTPLGVPVRHLVVVAQIAGFDPQRTVAILARGGWPGVAPAAVAARLPYLRKWVDSYAPEEMRFEVASQLPAAARALAPEQRGFLTRLADALDPAMDAEQVHALVYELAGAFTGTPPARLFEAIYLALLGRSRGPRAGWFVSLLGVDFCAARFREAAAAQAATETR